MSTPALLQLPDFSTASKNQLGVLGRQFASLHSYGVPFPPMFALTVEMLSYIAQSNNLLTKVEKLTQKKLSPKNFTTELSLLIRKQRLPTTIATSLAKLYHSYCKNVFVSLLSSPVQSSSPSVVIENITGEAALQEAVLELWGRTLEHSLALTSKSALSLEKLIPAALLIQQQPEATVSGTGFTRHPLTGNRSTLLIQSSRGTHTAPLPTGEGDSFEVDALTYRLLRKNIRTQTTWQKQVLGGFETKSLASKKTNTPTVSEKQLERIARLLFHIKQKSLHHYRIIWILERETLYCLRFAELHPVSTQPSGLDRTITRLYANIHTAQSLTPEILAHRDGVGTLRLEYTYAKFGMHPLATLQNNYHRLLKKELSNTITKTADLLGNLPLTVRSQSFTSSELRKFSKAAALEPIEPNPYLGLRGGLKALEQPAWFAFELELIAQLQKKLATPINFLVPFVRTPTELARLSRVVDEYLIPDSKHKPLWVELNTPASVFSLSEFPLKNVGGVVIRFEHIHALLTGYDPTNPDVAVQYPTTLSSLELILKHTVAGLSQATVTQDLKTAPAVRLQLDTYNSQYSALAVQFGIEGIVIQPKALMLAKNSILEAEAQLTANK